MRSTYLMGAIALLTIACSPLERSRELGNEAVPATALAQQVCAACHGVQGISTSPNFPHLAAQRAAYLESQLKAFRNHRRADPAGFEYMWGLSRHLTDSQIRELAAYYASQQPVQSPIGTGNALAAGRAIVEHGLPDKNVPACASCHGQDGRGSANFPRLAGQHADYMVKQLRIFQRSDDRPDGQVMQVVAHGLSDKDMLDVTTYLASLTVPAASP